MLEGLGGGIESEFLTAGFEGLSGWFKLWLAAAAIAISVWSKTVGVWSEVAWETERSVRRLSRSLVFPGVGARAFSVSMRWAAGMIIGPGEQMRPNTWRGKERKELEFFLFYIFFPSFQNI
jgi:hypothetical protein